MDLQQSSGECKLQEIHCNLGLLSRTDGSVLLSQGQTTVMAGCYGPVETKSQKQLIDKANVEVYYRPKTGLPGVADRLYEAIIRNICETSLVASLYPRTTVLVVVQEMHNNGGLMSCAVNAACLALLDSGIDMRFMVASVSCILDDKDVLCLDLGVLELKSAKAVFVFVFDSAEGRIVASHTSGTFQVQHFTEALQICKQASTEVFNYYKSVIRKKYMA